MNNMPPPMALALCASFDSVEVWRDAFMALVREHAGSGRVELVFIPQTGSLENRWSRGESSNGGVPILALPLPADVDDFIATVSWAAVYQRYQDAVHATGEAWAASQHEAAQALLIDVRRAAVFDAAPTMLPGAVWRDPARARQWAAELPPARAVLVYCVYGHEVGRVTALRLRSVGVNARFLSGGIDAWERAGLPTMPKGETP